MRKIYLIIQISLFLFSYCLGSFEKIGTGASSIGLSLSGIASQDNYFTIFSNPAALSSDAKLEAFYRNHYGIKDFDQIALSATFSLNDNPVGLGIQSNGNNLYSETEIIIGSSFRFSNMAMAGISFSLYHLEIKNYGQDAALGIHLAFIYQINNALRVAAVAANINEPVIGQKEHAIPVSGSLGFAYIPIEKTEILLDIYKEDLYNFEYRIGTRIEILENLNLLSGFQDAINSFSAGLEYINNGYGIFYSVDIHPVLNASHAIGLNYEL